MGMKLETKAGSDGHAGEGYSKLYLYKLQL
jgi:hypothetical protein